MRLKYTFLTLGLITIFSSIAFASPVFVYRQGDGTIRFSTRKPQGVQAQVFTAKGNFSRAKSIIYSKVGGYYSASASSKQRAFVPYIKSASSKYGVGSDLISAVIHAESAFNPMAISRKGARGLMQLMPFNGKMLGVKNLFSPYENIHAGTRFLARLINKFNGNLSLALAAYNAGEGAVQKYNGIPPYNETRTYVTKVLSLKDKYRRASYG